ncbi:M20/M25/M40 family metallo-hydrolase [Wenzhouxiangella sp. 15181]|nr:M20/M25/M40 family metallo-hydrolase [Wenzhouxiangella sp. 15181]RFP68468.1 M20/M25/M40 family metallo-hydrolase [Wenzhouxiangella sp. 15190]
MMPWKVILAAITIACFGLIAVMVWNTARMPSTRIDAEPPGEEIEKRVSGIDGAEVATHLAEAVRFRTISSDTQLPNEAEPFLAFHDWLEATYPDAHGVMERERVNELSLLYRWPGRSDCKPVGFISHLDVVPVEEESIEEWSYPPFGGTVTDGYVWGRGSVDTKSNLVMIMEAVERLAEDGYTPSCDIYLLFGHDEEIGGSNGAGAMSQRLAERGIHFDWVLDESGGGSIHADGSRKWAQVTLSQRGYVTLELKATGVGGHSALPLRPNAILRLSRALMRLSDSTMPGGLQGLALEMVKARVQRRSYLERLLVANTWITKPVVERIIESMPGGAAILRTTHSPTVIDGGQKDNVLPKTAHALINFRVHPRDDIEFVRNWVRESINDDSIKVSIHQERAFEAPPATDPSAPQVTHFKEVIGEVYGSIDPLIPGFGLAASDARHYAPIADALLKFEPVVIREGDSLNPHDTNERLPIDSLARGVVFYQRLIERQE